MGHFSITCAVSGLPISCGTPVKALLVSQNPYEESRACYTNGRWVPRTHPIDASYNDYGSINYIKASEQEKQLWLEGLKIDLVEQGWGRNTIHDTPTRKEMSFEDLINSLSDGRLQVEREINDIFPENKILKEFLNERKPDPVEENLKRQIPTVDNITKILVEHGGFKEFACYGLENSVIVREIELGMVSVMAGSFNDKNSSDFFAKVTEVLNKAGFITAVTASSEHNTKRVIVHPGLECEVVYGRTKPERPVRVDLALIRRDVWDAILSKKVECWWLYDSKQKHLTYPELLKNITEVWNNYRNKKAYADFTEALIQKRSRFNIFEDRLPYFITQGCHARIASAMDWKPEEEKAFLENVAGIYFIDLYMSKTRFYWTPSEIIGPQDPEWKSEVEFLKICKDIASKEYKEERALMKELYNED